MPIVRTAPDWHPGYMSILSSQPRRNVPLSGRVNRSLLLNLTRRRRMMRLFIFVKTHLEYLHSNPRACAYATG